MTVQRDATQSSLFIILQVHSACFGCQPHTSSGVHKTETTSSGTGHIFCAATSLQHGQAWLCWREVAGPVPEAVVTVLWSYFLCSYLPPTWPSLAMLEGASWTGTGGCSYSFVVIFFVQLPPSNVAKLGYVGGR